MSDMVDYAKLIQQSVDSNNAWSANEALKQRNWQKAMSNTAHQREVADLQAAGLNPILSAGGSGAAVTAGAQGNPDQSGTAALAGIIGNLLQNQTQLATAATAATASELVANISGWSAQQVAQINQQGQTERQTQQQQFEESHPTTLGGVLNMIANNVAQAAGYNSTGAYIQSKANKFVGSGSGSSPSSASSAKKGVWETIKTGASVLKNMLGGK